MLTGYNIIKKSTIMGFDDLFENENKHHKHGYGYRDEHDGHNRSSHPDKHYTDLKYQLLNKLQSNPKLKVFALVAAGILIILLILVIILLLPLLVKLFHYISQNGVEGIINAIWKGTK
jgi:hypothetical protein